MVSLAAMVFHHVVVASGAFLASPATIGR
jgi:hypothetical protein